MKHIRPVLAVAAGALLAAGAAATPAQASTAPRAAAPQPHVCAGIDGCVRYSFADVDGDGQADQTGLVVRGTQPDRSYTVVERTARGVLSTYEMNDVDWVGKPSVQGVEIDGVAGAELAVGQYSENGVSGYRMLTWRTNHLVRLGEPVDLAMDSKDPSVWGVSGTTKLVAGITRTMAGSRPRIHITYGVPVKGGYDRATVTSEWQGSGWKELAGNEKVIPWSQLEPQGGWHVPGMRRWG